MLRKHILPESDVHRLPGQICIADAATVWVSSERPDHPIDCICDGRQGPGGTRWIAEQPGDQTIVLAFDAAHRVHTVRLEVEEPDVSRTQEVTLATSCDGGRTYRELLRQEYTFSPGTTFEHEEWRLPPEDITNLRLWIRPDKSGKPCHASVTSLALN